MQPARGDLGTCDSVRSETAMSVIDGCWSTPLDAPTHRDQRNPGKFHRKNRKEVEE
jgi:hypothetical protein